MDTTQDNEFLKSHPVEKKQEEDFPGYTSALWKTGEEIRTLKEGMELYQRIATENKNICEARDKTIEELSERLAAKDKEIERLKELIEDAFFAGMLCPAYGDTMRAQLQQFKHNNL